MRPRIAKERSDAGEPRVEKILELVASSKYSIHDLSRCQAREGGEYYRLNMPFELGLDFGCRRFGAGRLARKVILVLEQERFRYQAAISDLAGSDVEAHHGDHAVAVRKVRNWLAGIGGFERIGGARVLADYEDFQRWYLDRQRATDSRTTISRTIRPRSFLRPCSNGTLNGRARSADLRANTASGHDGHEKAKRSRTGAIPPIPEQPMHEDPRYNHHGPSTRGGVK